MRDGRRVESRESIARSQESRVGVAHGDMLGSSYPVLVASGTAKGSSSLLKDEPGDMVLLHLSGQSVEGEAAGIAVVALDGKVAAVARAPVNL